MCFPKVISLLLLLVCLRARAESRIPSIRVWVRIPITLQGKKPRPLQWLSFLCQPCLLTKYLTMANTQHNTSHIALRHEALAPDCTGPKGREEGPEHSVQVAGPWKARGQASAASVHLTPDQVASHLLPFSSLDFHSSLSRCCESSPFPCASLKSSPLPFILQKKKKRFAVNTVNYMVTQF